jgi:hypothetical protein
LLGGLLGREDGLEVRSGAEVGTNLAKKIAKPHIAMSQTTVFTIDLAFVWSGGGQ